MKPAPAVEPRAKTAPGALAEQVADKLTEHDALATHLRDELGMAAHTAARPVQAALASAGTFAVGAALPLLMVLVLPAALYYVCAKKWHSAVPDQLILPVEQNSVVQPKTSGAGRAAAQA